MDRMNDINADAVYVVTAYRWGDHESHSYLVGAYSTEEAAWKARAAVVAARGNKYDCDIEKVRIRAEVEADDVLEYPHEEIYRCPGHTLLKPPDLGAQEAFAQECVNRWGFV